MNIFLISSLLIKQIAATIMTAKIGILNFIVVFLKQECWLIFYHHLQFRLDGRREP